MLLAISSISVTDKLFPLPAFFLAIIASCDNWNKTLSNTSKIIEAASVISLPPSMIYPNVPSIADAIAEPFISVKALAKSRTLGI